MPGRRVSDSTVMFFWVCSILLGAVCGSIITYAAML